MRNDVEILDLGLVPFEKAWRLQRELVEKRACEEIPDTLILCEHQPVYTFGRNYKDSIPQSLPFPAHQIERGGKATYHGPGQLILYPIFKLKPKGILPFVRLLERFVSALLDEFGLKAETRSGETGVWIRRRKIASIGIAVRRWVSFHGVALNVNPDITDFFAIQPCGYSPEVMTSMAIELQSEINVSEVKERFLARNLLSVEEVTIR